MKYRTRPLPADALVLILTLLLGGLPLLSARDGQAGAAVVTVDGTEVGRFSLSGADAVLVNIDAAGGVRLTIELQNGRARVRTSNCPDHVCVDTGWLDRPGMSAVCLPGRAVLRVEGGDAGAVDAVAK